MQTNPPKCSRYGGQPRLVLEMFDVRNGGTLFMFKCACGDQTWHHDKE